MATVGRTYVAGFIESLGAKTAGVLTVIGGFTFFALRTLGWTIRRFPKTRNLVAVCYVIGAQSVPVVAVTGMFIGMVMAVQFYHQFYAIGLETRLGAVINVSLCRELGPVLAATMLAGRVGGAMAAELATMRVTEQVDALTSMGTSPIAYLVVPRVLACALLIPLLTIIADFTGILGGAFICTNLFGIEPGFYWNHARKFVGVWDLMTGIIKAFFFGIMIALISCQRGLNSKPGAEGVGKAATEAFVCSFVAILVLDFFLGVTLLSLYKMLWPGGSLSFV